MSINGNPHVSGRGLAVGIGITALAAGIAYGLTLNPTVTGEDSGELIAAAYTLGIPHPPGYPLWSLTVHAAIKLIPFGEVAWRANLVSALFGVLAACTVSATVMRLSASVLAGITGGLSFAFAYEVWEQSIIAEVYTQFAFLFALTLYLVLRWRQTGRPRMLYGAAFAGGLGVVAHGLMILALPVFAITALWPRDGQRPSAKQIAFGSAAFAAPFLLLLYLPIRSAADPPMDWGNPESFAAFWDVMTRTQYESLLVGHPRSLGRFADQLLFFLRELQLQPMLLTPVALVFLHFVNRSLNRLLIALFAFCGIGAILLTNFPLEERDMWLNTAYWLPVYVVCAIWSGLLVGMAQNRLPVRWQRVGSLAFLVTAATCLPLLQTYLDSTKAATNARGRPFRSSENRFVYEYAENQLLTLPRNAIYIGGGDHTLFPLLYLQIVEGRRPDVTVANPYGYIDVPRIDGLAAAFPDEADKTIPSLESEPAMVAWMAEHSGRPVYSANPWKLDGLECQQHGFLYRIAPPGDSIDDPYAIWDAYSFEEPVDIKDWSSRLIQFDYLATAAERDIAKGLTAQAESYLVAASTFANWTDHFGGGNKHELNNLAIIAASGGFYDLAEEFWLRALEIDPEFELAQRNLEKLREMQG